VTVPAEACPGSGGTWVPVSGRVFGDRPQDALPNGGRERVPSVDDSSQTRIRVECPGFCPACFRNAANAVGIRQVFESSIVQSRTPCRSMACEGFLRDTLPAFPRRYFRRYLRLNNSGRS
jgi:hypothetical protein